MPNLLRAKISSIATHVPPNVLRNKDLEARIDTSDSWIVERTGIRQRHIAGDGVASSDLAVEVAKKLLVERGIAAAELEVILVATVTPDMMFPATACILQDRLGAKGAWGFDISAGCSGFVYALQTAAKFIETGAHKKVLVVGVDVMSSIVDYTDRRTCVIFGDGAGAVLVEPATDENHMIDYLHEIDGSGASALYMPGGGSRNPASRQTVDNKMHYVHLVGQAMPKYATAKMAQAGEIMLKRHKLSPEDVTWLVPTQSNRRMFMAAAEKLGIQEERVLLSIDQYGNTAAASIPLALDTARRSAKLKRGDLVLIISVGAGFTSGVTLLRWAV